MQQSGHSNKQLCTEPGDLLRCTAMWRNRSALTTEGLYLCPIRMLEETANSKEASVFMPKSTNLLMAICHIVASSSTSLTSRTSKDEKKTAINTGAKASWSPTKRNRAPAVRNLLCSLNSNLGYVSSSHLQL